jgi:hypothetical protein
MSEVIPQCADAETRPHRNTNPGDLERDLMSKGSGWNGPYEMFAPPPQRRSPGTILPSSAEEGSLHLFFALTTQLPYF